MSDAPIPPASSPSGEVEVDLASFLPEGVSFEVVPAPDVDPGPEAGTAEVPKPSAVDVAVLTRVEGELAAVDEALVAIDAGQYGRSSLLTELLDGTGPDRT